jgi:DNA-binding response OmpR family regulator
MTRVLIAEDDLLISDMLEEALVGDGYEICGVAATVRDAVALAERTRPDLCIIDVRLAEGGDGTMVAARLMKQQPGVGVLYTTGNADYVLATRAVGHACLMKPYRLSEVLGALRVVEQMARVGTTPSSVSPGLMILNQAATGVADG